MGGGGDWSGEQRKGQRGGVRLELYRRPGMAWKEGQRAVIRNHEIVAFLAGAVIRQLAIHGAPSAVRKEGMRRGRKERKRRQARR